jgi:hypothetical protein
LRNAEINLEKRVANYFVRIFPAIGERLFQLSQKAFLFLFCEGLCRQFTISHRLVPSGPK